MYLNNKLEPRMIRIVVVSGFASPNPQSAVVGSMIEVAAPLAAEVIGCGRARRARADEMQSTKTTEPEPAKVEPVIEEPATVIEEPDTVVKVKSKPKNPRQ